MPEDIETVAQGLVKIIEEKDKIITEYQKLLEGMLQRNDEMTKFLIEARVQLQYYQEAVERLNNLVATMPTKTSAHESDNKEGIGSV